MATSAEKDAPELRQRIPHGATSGESVEDHGQSGPADGTEGAPSTAQKGQKTYGRTPDGTGKPSVYFLSVNVVVW